MKKLLIGFILTVVAAGSAHSQSPSASEILRRVDDNEIFQTIQYQGEMVIEQQTRRGERQDRKTMNVWARGNNDSFIEFTNREDRGIKYLMTGGRLTYFHPDNERVLPVPGHMLREWMGSDLSFEDVQENASLSSRYRPVITGTEVVNGRSVWVLELTAISTETYPVRKLWIDRENFDLLRSELFALSGVKLQETTLLRTELINGRRFPVEIETKNLMRNGSRTVYIIHDPILDQPIPDTVFHERNLTR